MTTKTIVAERERIDRTVRVLCPIIEQKIIENKSNEWSEKYLRRELVACILGSQVRHEMASLALSRLDDAGLLEDKWWLTRTSNFENRVRDAISGSVFPNTEIRSYRYPKVRSKQILGARNSLVNKTLIERLSSTDNAKEIRQCLVKDIPGIGPKQASMFLRNIGKSHDLAIIDTHVLRFLDIRLELTANSARIGNLNYYEQIEDSFAAYANTLGFSVGYLDWAVWATMKAARELRL